MVRHLLTDMERRILREYVETGMVANYGYFRKIRYRLKSMDVKQILEDLGLIKQLKNRRK